ncbi:hypothetical protein M9H77_00628 [Catharanthus roseus]|nr:hypothetical protein M9H77_00628 [Catharanthus roseus]
MEAVICRTGSGSIPVPRLNTPTLPRVSSFSLPVHESFGGDKSSGSPTSIRRRSIHRVSSMPSVIRSEIELSGGAKSMSRLGSRSFPAKITEEEDSLTLTENRRSYAGDWPHSGIPVEELGLPGGGIGKNWNFGGGGSGDELSAGDGSSIASYYEKMLRSDPTNALLLRNYGKYLHEVEKNYVKAEEFYGRAILASPGDGEVLLLYGKLIWETQRDESRTKSYFDQAVNASPDDCTILGSYAHFMWEANEDEEEEEEEVMVCGAVQTTVEAF